LIHYFCLGLKHVPTTPSQPRSIGLAKDQLQIPAEFFEPLPNELLDAFEGKHVDFAGYL
jgi:hypothetical protein